MAVSSAAVSIERLAVKAVLGEGALWHASNKLWWVDIKGQSPKPSLNVLDTVTGENRRFYVPSRIGTVVGVTGKEDEAVVALETGVYALDMKGLYLQKVADAFPPDSPLRMNDGKCDGEGRLYVGSMFGKEWEDGVGALHSLSPGRTTMDTVLAGQTIPNGIVWTNDTMYHIDTPTLAVSAYAYNPADGSVDASSRKDVISFAGTDHHYPDGMTLDSKGRLWIACFNGSKVVCYDPATGEQVGEVPIPTPQVTSVAFGPDGTLYVTSGAEDLTPEQLDTEEFRYAGQMFRVKGLDAEGVFPTATFHLTDEARAEAAAKWEPEPVPAPEVTTLEWTTDLVGRV